MADLRDQIERLRADPGADDVAAEVRELGRSQSEFEPYAAAFAERGAALAARGEVDGAIEARVEAALVFEEDLRDLHHAAEQYEAVLALRPDHRRARFSLGLLLHDLERWGELIDLYRDRIRNTSDPGEQTTLHLYIAEVLSEQLRDDARAFEEVMAAARLAPQNLRIIGRLEELGVSTGRHEEVAVTIGDLLLNQQDPKLRAALSLRLAELYLGPVGDETRALSYLRSALVDDGANPEILQEMEDVFRERDRFDAMAELLESAAEDRRVGPHRVRLERDLARIYELELGDLPRALRALTRAVPHAPEDRELLDEVMRLGLVLGDLEPVAETYEAVVAQTDNALLATYMRLKLGHIYAHVLDRPAEALRVFSAILAAEPAHQEARRRLTALVSSRFAATDPMDAPPELVEASRRLLALDPESEVARRIMETRHDQAERADSGVDAAGIGVGDSAVMTGLHEDPTMFEGESFGPEDETQYAEDGIGPVVQAAPIEAPEAVVEAPLVPEVGDLDRAGEVEDDDGPADEAPEIVASSALGDEDDGAAAAPVVEASSGDEDDAPAAAPVIEASSVLGHEDEDDAAVLGDEDDGPAEVVEAADVAAVADVAGESADPAPLAEAATPPAPAPFSFVVAEAEAALRSRAPSGLSSRQKELEAALADAEGEDAASLLEELVHLAESVDDDARALEWQARLTEHAPTDERVDDLMKLGEGLGPAELSPERFGRWLQALERAARPDLAARALFARAAGLDDPREAALFTQRAVTELDGEGVDAARAADVLTEARAADPRAELTEALARHLEAAGRHAALAEVWAEALDTAEGPERVAAHLRVARARTAAGDLEGAEAQLRLGLEEQAGDSELLEALYERLAADGRAEAALEVGERRCEALRSPALRSAWRLRLAEVAEDALDDPGRAEALLAPALDEPGLDGEVLRRLARLRRAREDWAGLTEVLERMAANAPAPDDRAEARRMLAQVRADQRGDLDGAAALLREALEMRPEHDETLGQLADLEVRRGDFVGAADVLRAHAEARPEDRRAPVRARLGLLLWSHFTDAAGARAELEAVLEAEPEHEAAQLALLDIAEHEEDFVAAHALATRAAGAATAPHRRAELWVRAGRLARHRLGDERRAIEAYQQAILADPDDAATEAEIGELLLARGEAGAAYRPLFSAATGLADPERAAALFTSAGQAAEAVDRPDDARAAYEAVLERRPTDEVALERLCELRLEAGDAAGAHAAGTHLLLHHEGALSAKDRAQIFTRMARARRADGDMQDALRLARQAHLLDAGRTDALELMADALEAEGEAFEAAECLKRLAPRIPQPSERAQVLLRAGVLLQIGADDPARAAAMLSEAQGLAPDHEEIAERLAACRARTSDAAGAATALEILAGHRIGETRALRLVQAARHLIGAHLDRARARALLEAALEAAPNDESALETLGVLLEFDADLDALGALWARAADTETDPERRRALRLRAVALYRDRLEDPGRALTVLRAARAEAAATPRDEELYARLLDAQVARDPDGAEPLRWESIRAWSGLVEGRPGYVEGWQRLYTLRTAVGETALARIAAEQLQALGEAGLNGAIAPPDPPARVVAVDIPVDDAEGGDLAQLLDRLGYPLMKALGDLLPEPRPKKRDLVGPAALGIHVSRPLAHAAGLLGGDAPPVYVLEDAPAAVVPVLVAHEPALMVSLAQAQALDEAELRFRLGYALSLLRPSALATTQLPLDAVREALVGFAKLPDAEAALSDPKLARRRGKALDKALPPDARGELADAVGTWLSVSHRPSLDSVRQAVLRTAERTGLVACGSLAVSLRALQRMSHDRVDRRWRVPLLRFAATRTYAEIVRRLRADG